MIYNIIIYGATNNTSSEISLICDSWENKETTASETLNTAKKIADGKFIRGFVLDFSTTPPTVIYELKSGAIRKL